MVRLLKDNLLIAKWQKFFEEKYKGEIETIALEYPKKRSLYVDFEILDKYDTELSNELINQPYKYIYNAEESITKIDTVNIEGHIRLHFRIKNLPDYIHVNLRNIRAEHLGKIIALEGIIKKHTPVKANIKIGVFQCQKCGGIIRVEQEEEILKEPTECFEDQGGCGRVSTFKLITNLSEFIDYQKIQLQENPENLQGSEQPQKIVIYIEDDIVGNLFPGDRVRINGILHSVKQRKGQHTFTTFDFCMETISYEIKETAYEDIQITTEDIKLIKQTANDSDIYEKMKNSIAPTIYGMNTEKEALILQLFGGNKKICTDDTKIRGDIHILLIGDPSTAKSQLMKAIHNIAPRSILTSGSGSTKAGLTATAVRDEFSENQWVLEAGALVLANKGIACIDEFDKMHEEDRSSIHPAMEQQEIPISKAGINVNLKSECSVLAVANPKYGRYDEYMPMANQIDMPSTLLTRFDLIFSILDKPDREKDKEIAEHILWTHQKPDRKQIIPFYDKEFLRKYIAYAKQNITPKLTEEAIDLLQKFYVDFRNANTENVTYTTRQLEALIRIAEAYAKIRLSEKVTVEDAKRSITLMGKYLQRICKDIETGNFDIDIIETGVSHTQQTRIKTILETINSLCKSSKDQTAEKYDIIKECESQGIEPSKTESDIDFLKRQGKIFEPIRGKYRCSNY